MQLAGLRAEGPLRRLCRFSVSGLPKQTLLSLQAAWAHHHDLPIQNCARTWLHTGCLNLRRYFAESSTEARAWWQVTTNTKFCSQAWGGDISCARDLPPFSPCCTQKSAIHAIAYFMQAAELRLCTAHAAHQGYLWKLPPNGKLTLPCCGCILAAARALSSTQPKTTLSLAGTRRDKWQSGTMPKSTTGQCIT